jgi:hypothetical protein
MARILYIFRKKPVDSTEIYRFKLFTKGVHSSEGADMKRFLMVFLTVILLSTAASAQIRGYLCLFSDVDHTEWCASAATIPGSFTMYVYMLPKVIGSPEDGSFGAEFMIEYPDDPTVLVLAESYNGAEIPVVMGSFAAGVSLGFDACKTDWFLIATQMIVTQTANLNTIYIRPHPTSGGPSLADCGELHAKYDATVFNNLYINYDPGAPECGETATSEASWSAIKTLYTD